VGFADLHRPRPIRQSSQIGFRFRLGGFAGSGPRVKRHRLSVRVGWIKIERHVLRKRGRGQDGIDHCVGLERTDDDTKNIVVSLHQRLKTGSRPIDRNHDDEAGPHAADRIAELEVLGRGHDVAVPRALNGPASSRL